MPTFTVHERNEAAPRFERTTFVRDGFHFWAFVFGPFWLVWHRLWWASLAYIAMLVMVALAFSAFGIGESARTAISIMIALVTGLEAATLRRWTLSRGKWRQTDLIVADDREQAEVRYFARRDELSGPRTPPRETSTFAPPLSVRPDVIGSFPQAGTLR